MPIILAGMTIVIVSPSKHADVALGQPHHHLARQ